MKHYWRAFWIALKMTLRGEMLPPPQKPPIQTWLDETLAMYEALMRVADTAGYPLEQRKALSVRVNGRTVSMETILRTVHFHLTEEYPHLLKHSGTPPQTAIRATNLDDHYAVLKVLSAVEGQGIERMLHKFSQQLEAIPSDLSALPEDESQEANRT